MKYLSLKFISTRVVTLYLILFCIGYMLLDHKKYQEGVMVRTLNDLLPKSYAHLMDVAYGIAPLDEDQWQTYIHYYEKITQYHPDMAEAYGLLGFCYYQLGDTKKAIEKYKQAIALNQYFFWFPYNLGVLYLKTGQYEQAKESFQTAMKTKPEHVLLFIKSSELIYAPIAETLVKTFQVSITGQLIKAYGDAQRFVVLTEKLISSSEKIPDNIINKVELKSW